MYNQEYIVDEIIKKDLTKQYPELKKLIKKTSPHEIRGGIMSVLDKDRRVHRDIKFYENLNKECEYNTYTDEIVVNVRKYIEVADCEVKTHGEVMTPISLVEDMLNTLPDEVWSNKDLKWLDPCCGVGTFQSIIVQRLMKGLKTQIPNPKKRYKHIIEEMIYVCELQAKNLFAFHYVFDKPDIYELNTFYGSFLTDEFNEHMKNEWNIEKFDIIVGNPPYNDGSNNRGSAHVLWDKFVSKSLDILIDNGYLCMVHPCGWRNVEGGFKNLQKKMLNNTFLHLSLHSTQEGMKTFGATTPYDYYTIQKTPNTKNLKTTIRCFDDEVIKYCLNGLEFIPNGKFDMIFSLVANDDEEKVIVIEDCSYHHQKQYVSANKNTEYKYPCVYSIKKGSTPTFKYSNCNDKGHFGIKKMIFGNGANPTYMKDENGIYGMTQFSFAVCNYDLNIIEKAIQSNEIKIITEMTKFVSTAGNPIVYPKIISLFRKDFWKEFIND
jgi:hypothetical protein